MSDTKTAPAECSQSKKKQPQQTWAHIFAETKPVEVDPENLITREQVIEGVREHGAEYGFTANVGDLRFWEARGILPRPIRKWRDGVGRALYPRYAVGAILQLRYEQSRGMALDDIAQRLREAAADYSVLPLFGEDSAQRRQAARARMLGIFPSIALQRALWDFAMEHERATGTEIKQIEVRLITREEKRTTYSLNDFDKQPPDQKGMTDSPELEVSDI